MTAPVEPAASESESAAERDSTRLVALARLPARLRRKSHAARPLTEYREFRDGEVVPGTRYRVTSLIGAGGMGRVYEVEHIELGKRFVLKALQRELSRREDLVARLRNEWRALARLEHPSIVNVTDAGMSENGVPFYVMERLDGETLSSLMHRQRRLHPQQALAIAAGMLEGLHAAHQIGVVHRDVKPPNIFLVGPMAVKILDFGIAKIRDAKDVITARGIAVGTPRYMSPEQAQGTAVDARSDVYATGLILFEMVSGVGPFDDARDNNELLLAHLGRKAPLLSSISVVAPELDALVASMLAKDPRERPSDARVVAETLRALSQRYAGYPATDSPTIHPKPAPPEPPTRVDGPRRGSQPGPATRPDGVAARGSFGETTTAQPAFEIATTAAHPLPNVTLRLDQAAPPVAPPSLYGPDTLVEPMTSAPTAIPGPGPERTEMLLAAPPTPSGRSFTDPGPTRTAVPLADVPNLTPPPVVPSASVPPPRARSPLPIVLGGLVVAAGLAVAAWAALRSGASDSLVSAAERRHDEAPKAEKLAPPASPAPVSSVARAEPLAAETSPAAKAQVEPALAAAPAPMPRTPTAPAASAGDLSVRKDKRNAAAAPTIFLRPQVSKAEAPVSPPLSPKPPPPAAMPASGL